MVEYPALGVGIRICLMRNRTVDNIHQCTELVMRNNTNKDQLFSLMEDDGIPMQAIKYAVSLRGMSQYQS
jgi:hypothetical protein